MMVMMVISDAAASGDYVDLPNNRKIKTKLFGGPKYSQ